MADIVAEHIQRHTISLPRQILLLGFTEVAPQYLHLLKRCEQKGTQITHYQLSSRNQTAHCIPLTDTDTEIETMARYAKSLLNHSTSIGCVIPNLEIQRERVLSVFSDVIGSNTLFNISAGKKLISYPVIHAALQILQLPVQTITFNTFSSLLRSPFLGEAEREQYKRAQFDYQLRNTNRTTLTLEQLIHSQKKQNLTQSCPALAKRLTRFWEASQQTPLRPISEWVSHFTDLLNIMGWPGERSVNSQEYQVIQNSWLPLLNEYAAFDAILTPQSYATALHYLTRLISNTIFQPETPDAPIQILGLLEAADIPFEHLWVMGLDDTTWPSRPKPNPFIPLRVQKTLNMPNASAERELIYCQKLTQQLQHSATHLIISYPEKLNDAELRPSALLTHMPLLTSEQLSLSEFISPAEKIFATQQIEWLHDVNAPPISEGEDIRGGASIFKKQAECPFKAFAEIRLHAKNQDENTLGLRPQDRGSLVHKALEWIWADLKDSTTLQMKTDAALSELIHRYAKQALLDMINKNDNPETPRYFALEQQRLEKIIWDWLQVEKSRPPFTVIAQEKNVTATLGQVTMQLRIDRIDELEDGSQLIIDYKTGKNNDCKKWFSERPDEPQLPLYCLIHPQQTVGIAFAQLHPSEMNMIGVSKIPLPPINLLADIKHADASLWDEQTRLWHTHLTQLGNDFYQGHAGVNPKDNHLTCRHCHLQSVCRKHELNEEPIDQDNHE